MTDYTMPVLSEQERSNAIAFNSLQVRKFECFEVDRPLSLAEKIRKQSAQIALAALTAKPVAFTAQSNLAGFGGSVGYMWPPGNEKTSDVALYAKTPVPVIKQEGEQ